jgi:hypothetical protein
MNPPIKYVVPMVFLNFLPFAVSLCLLFAACDYCSIRSNSIHVLLLLDSLLGLLRFLLTCFSYCVAVISPAITEKREFKETQNLIAEHVREWLNIQIMWGCSFFFDSDPLARKVAKIFVVSHLACIAFYIVFELVTREWDGKAAVKNASPV